MGLLDTIFQVNAPRSSAYLDDLKFAKQEDAELAGNVRIEQQVVRDDLLTAITNNRMEDGSMVSENAFFKQNPDAFNKLKQKVENSNDPYSKLTVTDITSVLGEDKAGKYLNDTGLSGTFFGAGARLDTDQSKFVLDPNDGKYYIENPTVRVFDKEKGRFYSAPATRGGVKVSELFKQGQDKAVQDAIFERVPLSFVDELDEDYRNEVQGRTGGDKRLTRLGRPFGGNKDRAAIEQGFIDRGDTIDSRREKSEELRGKITEIENQSRQARVQEFEDKALKDYDFLSNPVAVGMVGESGVGRTFKTGNNFANSILSLSAEELAEQAPDYRNQPNTNPFYAPDNIFSNLDSTTQKAQIRARANEVDRINFEKMLAEGGDKFLQFGQDLDLILSGDATALKGAPAGFRDEAEAVNRFYEAQGINKLFDETPFPNFFDALSPDSSATLSGIMTADKDQLAAQRSGDRSEITKQLLKGDLVDNKLIKRFQERPDIMQEFMADPKQFALKYQNDDNGLYGPRKNTSVVDASMAKMDGRQITDAKEALEAGDVAAIRRIASEMDALSDKEQRALVADINRTGGDYGRTLEPERIALYFSMLGSLPQDSQLFEVLTRGDNLTNMIQYGVFDFDREKLLLEQQKEGRLGRTEAKQTEVDFDDAFVRGQIYDENGNLKDTPLLNQAALELKAPFEDLMRLRRKGPLSEPNDITLNRVLTYRLAIINENIKQQTVPSFIKEFFTLGLAEGASPELFTVLQDVDVFKQDDTPIKTLDEYFKLSKEERRRLKLSHRETQEPLSTQQLDKVLGAGTVETIATYSLENSSR